MFFFFLSIKNDGFEKKQNIRAIKNGGMSFLIYPSCFLEQSHVKNVSGVDLAEGEQSMDAACYLHGVSSFLLHWAQGHGESKGLRSAGASGGLEFSSSLFFLRRRVAVSKVIFFFFRLFMSVK